MGQIPMLSLSSAALSFNAAPLRAPAAQRASVNMAVEDLVGGINDPIFGGPPEGKIWDPLGLGQDEASLYRRRVVEIKHGRICMVAFLHDRRPQRAHHADPHAARPV